MTNILSNQDHGGVSRILNLPAPASPNEPVRLTDLNSAVEGLAWKDSARVATQANVNLASPGAAIDGVTMAVNDRVLVRAQTAAAENGIYVWNGAAVAMTRSLDASIADELESATLMVEEGTSAGVSYRQTAVNFTLGTGAVSFVTFGSSTPLASTTQTGTVTIATQSEVDAGTDTAKSLTPATLAAWSGRLRKYAAAIGDGSATAYVISHNLNTQDVLVQVRRAASPFDIVIADVELTSVNTATIRFSAAPAANAYRVIVMG